MVFLCMGFTRLLKDLWVYLVIFMFAVYMQIQLTTTMTVHISLKDERNFQIDSLLGVAMNHALEFLVTGVTLIADGFIE